MLALTTLPACGGGRLAGRPLTPPVATLACAPSTAGAKQKLARTTTSVNRAELVSPVVPPTNDPYDGGRTSHPLTEPQNA